MSTANISKSAAEVKLNPPKVFSGKRIAYLLSFMMEGDAASWKEEFLARKIDEAEKNDTDLKLGTFKEVKETIKKSFEPFDGPGDALEEMKCL